MTATAKVFTTGRSQAVRIPKDYRFDCEEVTIERDGERLVLTPKRARRIRSWAEFAKHAPILEAGFDIPKDPPGSERDIKF